MLVALHNAVSDGGASELAILLKPSYSLHHFYASYAFNDNITLRLMVKNAFDKSYRDHSSFADYSAIWEGFAKVEAPDLLWQ